VFSAERVFFQIYVTDMENLASFEHVKSSGLEQKQECSKVNMTWAQLFHVWLDALRETLAVVSRGRKCDKVVISSGRKERERVWWSFFRWYRFSISSMQKTWFL